MSNQEPATEVWKDIDGFENIYQVSSLGRVRSLDRIVARPGSPRGPMRLRGRVLSERIINNYNVVALCADGYRTNKPVHVAVLEAFVGPRPGGMEAIHIDGDPLNNTPENLRWGTHKENMDDRCKHGRTYDVSKNKRKLSDLDVIDILMITDDSSCPWTRAEIGRIFGVAASTIKNIVNGRYYSRISGRGSTPPRPVAKLIGEYNHAAKLKQSDVFLIRRLKEVTTMSNVRLSEIFGVSSSSIDNVVNGKTWATAG